MKYLYYPGCSLKGTARDFEESFKAIAPVFGIEIEEAVDWGCCGASVAKSLRKDLAERLPLKTLDQAAGRGLDLLTLCPNCYLNHKQAQSRIQKGEPANPSPFRFPDVKQLLEVLGFDLGLEEIRRRLVCSLAEINVLPYYGCLTVRPFPPGGTESRENPRIMEKLIAITGAKPFSFPYKVDCCGGGLLLSQERVALKLAGRLWQEAGKLSPDCLVVACPLCHFMLDAKQQAVERELGKKLGIPVLYVTQLLGLALGMDHKKLGLHRLLTSPYALLKKLNHPGEKVKLRKKAAS